MGPSNHNKSSNCLKPAFFSFLALILATICMLAFGLFFSGSVLTSIGKFIIYSDPLQKADAIAVLSGGGVPRLQEAGRLFKENQGAYIILTETGIVTENYGDLSQIEKNQLVEMGVQPRAIIITLTQVDATVDEATAVYKTAKTNNFKSLIIVTDTYHSLRTHLVYQNIFKGKNISIIIRPVRDDWYQADDWWKTPEGWQVTITEYSKLLGYLIEQRFLIK